VLFLTGNTASQKGKLQSGFTVSTRCMLFAIQIV
jgi:hypothetical protein